MPRIHSLVLEWNGGQNKKFTLDAVEMELIVQVFGYSVSSQLIIIYFLGAFATMNYTQTVNLIDQGQMRAGASFSEYCE